MSAPVDPPRSKIAAHTVLSMIAVLALGLTRLIFGLLVATQLGPDVLGRVNTQLSIATFASLAFATSTSLSASKFVAAALGGADEAEARRALLTLMRWCVLGTAAVTVAVAIIMALLFSKLSPAEIAATCVLFVAYSAYLFVRGAMYGYGTVRRYAVVETVSDAIAIAAAVLVVLSDADLILLLPFIIGYTLFAVFGWLGLPRPVPAAAGPAPALRLELRREMRGYTGWGALGVISSTGFLQLSMVFAYLFNSEFDAGLYAAAFNLTVPAVFVPRALSLALFPAMAGAFGRGNSAEVRRQLDRATRFLVVGGLPFLAAGVFFAEPLLILIGREFAGGHVALELLLASTFVVIVAIPAVNALSATHRSLVRVPSVAAAVGLLVGLVAWLVLARYGINGIAVGYLVGVVVASGISIAGAWRHWHLSWLQLYVRVGASVGAAVGLRMLANLTDNGLLVRLGCTLIVAAITTMVFFPEVRQLLRSLRSFAGHARGGLLAR